MTIGERIKILREKKQLTQEEIAKHLHVGKQAVYKYENGIVTNIPLDKLEMIAKILETTPAYLMGWEETTTVRQSLLPNAYPVEEGDFLHAPLIASVTAGYGGEAILEYTDEYIPFLKSAYRGYNPKECVALRIKGNSMYPRFLDGDYILVHQQASVDSGSTAVVIYNNDEATVKKVRYVTGEDWVELIPHNPEYQTKRIEGEALAECHVFGLVLALYREDI